MGHQKKFRWRCACGKFPYPSRTRWSSGRRPMVLRWRRRGRAGGRRDNNKKRSRKGFKGPAGGHSEQAGHKAGRKSGPSPPKSIGGINRQPYLENRILTKREPNDGGDPIGHRVKRERPPGGGEECTQGAVHETEIRKSRMRIREDPRKRHARQGSGRKLQRKAAG